jgi:hypothetical protein
MGKPDKKLAKTGVKATATVLEIASIGKTIRKTGFFAAETVEDDRKSKLRVEPEDEPAFEVSGTFRYPRSAIPAVGDKVPVIYDPSDHDKAMIGEIKGPSESELKEVAGTGIGSGGAMAGVDGMAEAQKWLDAVEDGSLSADPGSKKSKKD